MFFVFLINAYSAEKCKEPQTERLNQPQLFSFLIGLSAFANGHTKLL